jgi:hypothetical protein
LLVYLNRNGLCEQSGVRVFDEFHIEILIAHHYYRYWVLLIRKERLSQ